MSFTTAGAVLRLPQTYTLTSSLTLDASGLSRPVTILQPSTGGRHFILSSSAVSAFRSPYTHCRPHTLPDEDHLG